MKLNQRKNFSLVELLVVVSVIAILAGMSVGMYSYVTKKNRNARTLATIEMIKTGLEQFKEKYGYYPPSKEYIAFYLNSDSGVSTDIPYTFNKFVDYAHLTQPGNSRKSGSLYVILDGFGTQIYYRCPGYINRTSYDLGSLGADGKVGDGGSKNIDDADAKDDFGKGDDITNCKR